MTDEKKPSIGEAVYSAAFVVAVYGMTGVIALTAAWPVMIGLGVAHGVTHTVPAFGYLQVAICLWAARIVSSLAWPRQLAPTGKKKADG